MSESLQIKFDGQKHQIDANTLVNTLIHYNTVISETNNILGKGEYSINLKINALEKGSFIIDVSVVGNAITSLFTHGYIGYIADLMGIVGGVFTLYSVCKGKPVKDKSSIKINSNVNITINETTINIYNNPPVREAISKSVETAKGDTNVAGISIARKNNEILHWQKEEFEELVYTGFSDEAITPNEKKNIIEDAILHLITLSFESGKSWQVMFNGFKISLPVKDESLQKLIDSGERFAKGDAIRVKLEVFQRYNEEYKTYENKSFKILEFKEHLKTPLQNDIFS